MMRMDKMKWNEANLMGEQHNTADKKKIYEIVKHASFDSKDT